MMICLTVITIISIVISVFSLKNALDDAKFLNKMFKEHNERLREDIERKQSFIEMIDKIIEKME